jgi:DNA repair protein RecN (Recombination protein N)
LKKEVHIELLDAYLSRIKALKFKDKIEIYKQGYVDLLKSINEYDELKAKKIELDNKRNFIEFQVKEINEVNPIADEDDKLEAELKTSENTEGIQQAIGAAYLNLYDDSGSVIERLKLVEKELAKIAEYNPEIKKILEDISQTLTVINESARQLQSLSDTISFDPERIEQVRERLYKLQFLKKKYGGSLDEVISVRDNLEKDLSLADNFDENISGLETEIKSAKQELLKKAKDISKIRKDKSKQLEDEVVSILKEVGFENAEFKVSLTPGPAPIERGEDLTTGSLKPTGIDDVEFMVKINKGDEFSSLRKTASGGEVSRIMLAVKTVLAEADKVDILVFDEIDTGISGRIAQKVGRVMKNLSAFRQVIAITHLAQIAALADEHLLVEKETEGESTAAKIRPLNKSEKVIEVAKLLSGEKVTDASIKSAKELIES